MLIVRAHLYCLFVKTKAFIEAPFVIQRLLVKGLPSRHPTPQRMKVQKYHKENTYCISATQHSHKRIVHFTLFASTHKFSDFISACWPRTLTLIKYQRRSFTTIIIQFKFLLQAQPQIMFKMNTLFGFSRHEKPTKPPLQPTPPTPKHPGERIPYQQPLYSNLRNPYPFHDFPNRFSTNYSLKRVDPLRSYREPNPLGEHHRRQFGNPVRPTRIFRSQFLDHNEVGNLEGEQDSRDVVERQTRERVLHPPPRSFIEELKWLILLLLIFLAALGIALFILGVVSSIVCWVLRWLVKWFVRCVGCEKDVWQR